MKKPIESKNAEFPVMVWFDQDRNIVIRPPKIPKKRKVIGYKFTVLYHGTKFFGKELETWSVSAARLDLIGTVKNAACTRRSTSNVPGRKTK